ncbi:hypothetical protein ACGK9U_15835 [Mariniflexile sp. HNIBRBA6329]|uniref:hypothetical protein n=1 Tax=Mariniflexile sp. HNIBRBA6329 TaxID=3373088 RepID=UPI0037473D94
MIETIRNLTELIRVDIIIGFGLYSIVFFLFRRFSDKKEFLNNFDNTAVRFTIFAGITYGILWLTGLFLSYNQIDNEMDKIAFNQRLTGPYWYGYWLQTLFWLLLTQLLWIKPLKKSLIFRIILSILFLLSFERIVIIIKSFHRDFLPSSWSLNLSFGEIIIGLTIKTVIFILIISGIHFGVNRIKNVLQQCV